MPLRPNGHDAPSSWRKKNIVKAMVMRHNQYLHCHHDDDALSPETSVGTNNYLHPSGKICLNSIGSNLGTRSLEWPLTFVHIDTGIQEATKGRKWDLIGWVRLLLHCFGWRSCGEVLRMNNADQWMAHFDRVESNVGELRVGASRNSRRAN